MSQKIHPSFREENERCRYTLKYVEKTLKNTIEKKEYLDATLERINKHFNSDNSQDYIDMIVNSALKESTDIKLKNLVSAKKKPYFARVDFKEKGKQKAEKLYIGKMCLAREEDQELIIIDWRAPVANLYYEGRLGEANYDCPEGNIEGEILLKRQFFIEEGELLNIFDIDVTATDELLQSCLGANADNRLKDIVSTIQAEQNQIIRADMWKPLVVQGAAGSGKTTIALHRIAYLIYNHEKNFKPENFMIIAPNRLFLNYISNVLPELGVDKVKQTTFEQFAWDILERRLKLTDPNDKLMRFVKGQEQNDDMDMLKRTSELKSSIVFKTMLDDFFESVLRRYIPKEDFKILDIPVFSYEEINSLFLKEYKNWPVMYRINEIKKYLINRLKQRKNDIINSLHDECDLKIRIIKQKESDPEKRQRKIIDAIEKRDDIISNLNKYSKKAVDDYVKGLPKLDPFKCYRVFIESWLPRADANLYGADENILRYTSSHTKGLFDNKVVELEDLAPLIYLKYIIFGIAEKYP